MSQTDVKGYHQLTDSEIESINRVKDLGYVVGELINKLEQDENTDKRWLAIAKTDLQKGFMFLARSIAKPGGF